MNEIINNEEIIMEEVEETSKSGNGWLVAAGVAAVAAVGYGIYRAGKAIVGAIKAKKAEKAAAAQDVDANDECVSDEG